MVDVTAEGEVPQSKSQQRGGSQGTNPHTPVPGHGHSIPIARVARIPIRLHWTFFLLVVLVAAVDSSSGSLRVASGGQ